MTDDLTPVRCGCGGEARVRDYSRFGGAFILVECERCGTQTDLYPTETKAITAWNRAMGAKDINVPNKERTAKVIEHEMIITDADGCSYHRTKYICGNCKKKVIGGDEYCSHCGYRLDWDEDIPMEYFESGGR